MSSFPLLSLLPHAYSFMYCIYSKSEESFFSMKLLKTVPLGERHVVLTDHVFNERGESKNLTLPISLLSNDAEVLHH